MAKSTIRPIVKAAFKCEGLVYQFQVIDMECGVLEEGTMEEVYEKFDDAYIIGEAENRLHICGCQDEMSSDYDQEERELKRFLRKWA